MLLAADLGATKTNLAVFTPEAGPRQPSFEATLPSADYPDLKSLLRSYMSQTHLSVDAVSVGVAGPIVGDRATITNLGWVIETQQLKKALGVSTVRLLNDLQAIGCGVPWLQPHDVHLLNEGHPQAGGAVGVIAPGTGLGEAFLTWDGSRYTSHPSEGGHVDFAPTDDLQAGLLRFLQERHDHVSYELVCSGMGLPSIYAYLQTRGLSAPEWLAKELAQSNDPSPVIVNAALSRDRSCELCTTTLEVFVAILAAEAGNLALKVLATAGVYIGGGIPPRILPALEGTRFMEAFRSKGRLRDFMSCVPVKVILNPKVALYGAAAAGLGL